MESNPKIFRPVDLFDIIPEYTMTNDKGKSATATLVIVPKAKPGKGGKMSDMYVGFITNIKVDDTMDLIRRIPKIYRIRWGIETGYRKLEEIRARTNSPRIAARLFLPFFSLGLLNFWLLYKEMYADEVDDEDLVLFDFGQPLAVHHIHRQAPVTHALSVGSRTGW